MEKNTPEPLVSIDDQAFQYAKDNGITCTVEPSVVRSGAWRMELDLNGHVLPTVLDKDDAHTFANYVEIVNRTTLLDTAKHFISKIASLEAQLSAMREALESVRSILDEDNPDSYVNDDRSGAIDTAFHKAKNALASLDPTPTKS